jgi:two-component system phosphate regulon sensor histidine kinase PhoR
MSIQLRSAEAFEALLARGGNFVLLMVDDRLRITRAGAGAAQLADRSAEALVGLSLIAVFGSASLDSVAREAVRAAEPAIGEAQLGALGSRHFTVDAIPLGDGSLVIALHEISTLRRVERVRRDFVANISHELRTPLASIKLLAETLTGGAAIDPETAVSFAEQIGREVDHLAQLVDELLELSMIESGETKLALETLDPELVVATVAERIGPVAARRQIRARQLSDASAAGGVRALADPARLGQALLNLAHNAVKYSRPEAEVRLGWQSLPGFVRFTVADDGIGIADSHQARIFERFYKVDRSRTRGEADELLGGGSAGLGLAIVRHIAEAHGGSVGLESTEEIGSTFWVDVPRSA